MAETNPELPRRTFLKGVGFTSLFASTGALADGRKLFIGEHLGPLALAVVERPGLSQAPFYAALFAWVAELVEAMAGELGIELPAAESVPGEPEPDAVCGAGDPAAQESPQVGLGETDGG